MASSAKGTILHLNEEGDRGTSGKKWRLECTLKGELASFKGREERQTL